MEDESRVRSSDVLCRMRQAGMRFSELLPGAVSGYCYGCEDVSSGRVFQGGPLIENKVAAYVFRIWGRCAGREASRG